MTQEKRHQEEPGNGAYPPAEEQESASKTDPPKAPIKRAPQPGITSWPRR